MLKIDKTTNFEHKSARRSSAELCSSAWVAELEAELRRLTKLRADNANVLPQETYKDLYDACTILARAWNRERSRSATGALSSGEEASHE